jgi:hypothetical protein
MQDSRKPEQASPDECSEGNQRDATKEKEDCLKDVKHG